MKLFRWPIAVIASTDTTTITTTTNPFLMILQTTPQLLPHTSNTFTAAPATAGITNEHTKGLFECLSWLSVQHHRMGVKVWREKWETKGSKRKKANESDDPAIARFQAIENHFADGVIFRNKFSGRVGGFANSANSLHASFVGLVILKLPQTWGYHAARRVKHPNRA